MFAYPPPTTYPLPGVRAPAHSPRSLLRSRLPPEPKQYINLPAEFADWAEAAAVATIEKRTALYGRTGPPARIGESRPSTAPAQSCTPAVRTAAQPHASPGRAMARAAAQHAELHAPSAPGRNSLSPPGGNPSPVLAHSPGFVPRTSMSIARLFAGREAPAVPAIPKFSGLGLLCFPDDGDNGDGESGGAGGLQAGVETRAASGTQESTHAAGRATDAARRPHGPLLAGPARSTGGDTPPAHIVPPVTSGAAPNDASASKRRASAARPPWLFIDLLAAGDRSVPVDADGHQGWSSANEGSKADDWLVGGFRAERRREREALRAAGAAEQIISDTTGGMNMSQITREVRSDRRRMNDVVVRSHSHRDSHR